MPPEHLASPHLDELSGMTYLSYFMKEEDSPGYYATLDWVKKQIPNQRINNFRVRTHSWLPNELVISLKQVLTLEDNFICKQWKKEQVWLLYS